MPSVTLSCIDDSRIYQPNLGSGKADYLPVGLWAGDIYRSLVRFGMPNWSALGIRRITSAKLRMRTSSQVHVGRGSTPRMMIRRCTQNWSEGTSEVLSSSNGGGVTWSNQPNATTSGEVDSGTLVDTNGAWIEEDVTAIVRAWAPTTVESGGGQPNYGFQLRSFDEGSTTRTDEFYSQETGSDPILILNYESNSAPTAPTPISPVADAEGNPTIAEIRRVLQSGGGSHDALQFRFRRNDPDAGDYITAFLIQLVNDSATDATPGTILHDSGKITVAGAPTEVLTFRPWSVLNLTVGTAYRWRVVTWDKAGLQSPFSPLANARFIPNRKPVLTNLSADTTSARPNFYGSINDPDGHLIDEVRVRVYLDSSAGTVVMWDSGWVSSGGSRFVLAYGGSTDLSFGQKYRYVAALRDPVGSESAEVTEFVTPSEVVGPGNMTPRTVETKQNTRTPVLTIGHGAAFDAYELEVARYADGSEVLWDVGITTHTSTTSKAVTYAGLPLSWGGTYHWRAKIRVAGVTWSPWSPWYPFYINAAPRPPTVSIDGAVASGTYTPAVGGDPVPYVTVADTTPRLRILFSDPDIDRGYAEAATGRRIHIETDAGVPITGSPFVSSGTIGTVFVTSALTLEQHYRVRASHTDNAGVIGGLSDWLYFKVSAEPTVGAGAAVDVADPTPTLDWTFTGAAGKAQRQFRVFVHNDTTDELVHDSGIVESADTSYVVPPDVLEDATTYRWVVFAYDTDLLGSEFVAIPNREPTFDADLPNRSDAEGATISLAASATDLDGDPLTYEATGLPTGLSINASTGLISGTIAAGAAASSPYSVTVTVRDGATVDDTDTFTWTVTALSTLVISNIVATPTATGVTIEWDVSEAATGQVEYGTTTGYGSFSTKENSFDFTHHEQVISGLSPGTTYHFRVHAESEAGATAVSSNQTFTTPAAGVYPATSALQTIATPSVSRPAHLAVITDPTWDTEVRRITADGSTDRNSYATIPVWNADETRILLGYAPSSSKVLNASTFAVTHTISPGTGAFWSNTDPDVLYAAGSGDNVFRKFRYDGTLLFSRTFTGYSSVSMGNGEGGISDDDRFVALQTVAGGVPGILLYDILDDEIVATIVLSEAPNNVRISASGQYVIANFAGDSTGQHDGLWVLEVSGTALVRTRQLSIFGRHGDCGRDASGNDVWVTSIDKLSSFRLDTGARTDLLTNPNAFLVGHVSCRNVDRPGWCYVSVYDGTTAIGPGKDQVAAVKLDGSGDMQVFAHAHHVSAGNAGPPDTYIESPFAVPNRDGTKVAFGSEWDVTGRVNMYIAGVDV